MVGVTHMGNFNSLEYTIAKELVKYYCIVNSEGNLFVIGNDAMNEVWRWG